MAYGGASTQYENSGVGTSFTLSITGIPANSTVVVAASVRHTTVGSGDLISSVSSSPALATAFAIPTNGKGHRTPDDAASGRQGVYYFVGRTGASAADHTFTVNLPNTGNLVFAQAVYFTGHATTPFDVADDGTAANADSAIAAGPITPSQAAVDLLYFTAGKWWWDFSDPSGITKISESNDNSATKLPHWLGYKSIDATPSAQSVSWGVPASQGDGGLALIMSLKVGATGTKKIRAQFKSGSGINGVTGLTLRAWPGNSDTNYSVTYAGLTAEATGDRVEVTATGTLAALASGTVIDVAVYKTGFASEYGSGSIVVV